jgi:8-oxo-dGTP pyrophosphatase MutT (NUDIX family)
MIFSKDGKLFQGKKHPARGGVYPCAWHLPGGGIEEGEDKIFALRREVLEETGIDISPYSIELVDDKNADSIVIALNSDLVEYAWRDVADLKNTILTPPLQELFARLGYL